MTIKVAVVDDESIARARLRRLLSREPGIRVVADCAGGSEAVDAIIERRPDVVFLDVQMPECDGFQVVRALEGEGMPLIVFVTAYDEYAVRAFDTNALDYLLKPFDGERLRRTLKRVRERVGESAGRQALPAAIEQFEQARAHGESGPTQPPAQPQAPPRYRTNFLVRTQGRLRMVAAREVDSIESAANYVRLHVRNEKFLLRETIGSVAESLDPGVFVRVHRQTIVNISRVHEIHRWFSGDAILSLKDGRTVKMSRSYRRAFHDAIGG